MTGSGSNAPQSALVLEVISRSPETVLRVAGKVDSGTSPEFDRALRALEPASEGTMRLDLSGLYLLNSQGLQSLVSMFHTLQRAGRKLVLERPRPAVLSIFKITRIEQLIEVKTESA